MGDYTHGFHRLYKRSNALYKALLWILRVLIVAGLVCFVLVFDDMFYTYHFYPLIPPLDNWRGGYAVIIPVMLFAVLLPINIVLLVCLKLTAGRRGRKVYEKFYTLSEEEQAEINAELDGKSKHQVTMFGANRLYLYSRMFLNFINYRDIVWVYRHNIAVPVGMITDYGAEMSTGFITGVMVWERDGTRHRINTGLNGWAALDIFDGIKAVAPQAIIGFSRRRRRLVRRDIERFLLEGKDV